MSNEKKIATLSIVRNMTNSWRRKFGIKRTNFSIRNKRNVRNTLNPELPSLIPKNCWPNSNTLFARLWLRFPFARYQNAYRFVLIVVFWWESISVGGEQKCRRSWICVIYYSNFKKEKRRKKRKRKKKHLISNDDKEWTKGKNLNCDRLA